MENEHVPPMCKIGTHHKNDFDKVMHVVQISIGNYEIVTIRWWFQSEYYLITFEEEIKFEEASFNTRVHI